jgi:predicted RNA-binding Zn-ribbon protein involved in translation (DUF1610 family)/predicted transcriptional regulator
MRVRSEERYPYKLRVFADGRIKSRGLVFLSPHEYAKYVNSLKTCLDCNTNLEEYKPYKFKCPNCGETYSWGFSTLSRDQNFYLKHPEYAENDQYSDKFNTAHKKDIKTKKAIKEVPKISDVEDTYTVTYKLLQNNLSIDEIAEKRGLTKGTITNHIAKLVERGIRIDIGKYVSKEKQTTIIAAYNQLKSQKMKEIKEYLGEAYSYDEIRLVLDPIYKNSTQKSE